MPSILEELLPKAVEQTKRFGRYCLNQYRLWYARQEEKRRMAEYQRWIEQVKAQISEKVFYIFKGDSERYIFEEVPEYEQQETIVNGQRQLQTVQIGTKKMPLVKHSRLSDWCCDVFSVNVLGKISEDEREILQDFLNTLPATAKGRWVFNPNTSTGRYIHFCLSENEENWSSVSHASRRLYNHSEKERPKG